MFLVIIYKLELQMLYAKYADVYKMKNSHKQCLLNSIILERQEEDEVTLKFNYIKRNL